MEKRIYLSPPQMGVNEIKYIQEAFETNWIAPLGPNVDAFEKEICEYVGIEHGLLLSSGTAGIHLALKYYGVGPGDFVFCSSLTFVGSCNPILYLGAEPVFIDSEAETWNMCPIALQKAFDWAVQENKMPKAVVIVDLYGQSAQYDLLIPICKKYNVPIIEDAAEALGADYKGKQCGTFGDISVFSFNGNKIITTSGGGMVVSNNEEAIDKIRFWSTQAKEPDSHYEHKELGYNYRMSNVCAGIGRGQLEILDQKIKAKKDIYKRYEENLKALPLEMVPIIDKGQPNYWLTIIQLKKECAITPEQIISTLNTENIESRHVWKPMHLQPLFQQNRFFHNDIDVSGRLFKYGVCLPSGSCLEEADQKQVIAIIHSLFKQGDSA